MNTTSIRVVSVLWRERKPDLNSYILKHLTQIVNSLVTVSFKLPSEEGRMITVNEFLNWQWSRNPETEHFTKNSPVIHMKCVCSCIVLNHYILSEPLHLSKECLSSCLFLWSTALAGTVRLARDVRECPLASRGGTGKGTGKIVWQMPPSSWLMNSSARVNPLQPKAFNY